MACRALRRGLSSGGSLHHCALGFAEGAVAPGSCAGWQDTELEARPERLREA